jgi:hypothetical protein
VFQLPRRHLELLAHPFIAKDKDMTQDEIQVIERTLSIDLPAAYVDVMCPYLFAPGSSLAEYALPDSKEWLIQMNEGLRANGWNGAAWPHHFFVIGHDGGECCYFVDISQDDNEVYIISKEDCAIEEATVYALTLKAFVDAELEADEDLEESLRRKELRRDAKKWWELWD